MERQALARAAALLALGVVVIAVLIVLVTGGSTYVVHARFADAGQLVGGDLVTVAGHSVGSVGAIKLSPDGLADVELDISDDSITPLHGGTLATIGQLSLTGVANRFVGLTLSPAGAAIPSGGTLPVAQTRGIVDLDTLLDSLTPHVRSQLQQILRTGAYFIRQPTAANLNTLARYLNPAFSQSTQLGAQVVADKFALERLIASSGQIAASLAARSGDLAGAVSSTAAALREVAGERAALQDAVTRAPSVLQQATRVLAHVDGTLTVLDPVLVDLQPVAPRLGDLLQAIVPATRDAIPTVAAIEGLVPSAYAALSGLPPVVREATPAVRSLTGALRGLVPILAGLRPYGPDAVAGFFNGVGGSEGASYDANGHYLKSLLTVQAGGSTLSGLLNVLGQLVNRVVGAAGPLSGARTRLLAPCPGGGNPPAPDASNAWTTPDLPAGTGSLCNPADDQKP